jgi:hypothetical protein
VDDPVAVVDARNALRSRWPNLRENWFLERVSRWASRESVRALVVFDGRAPGGLVGEADLDGRTTLVGAGGSADDWIAERIPELAAHDRVWLVSSDRGLRARVAPHVVRTIGGGSFAGELEAL